MGDGWELVENRMVVCRPARKSIVLYCPVLYQSRDGGYEKGSHVLSCALSCQQSKSAASTNGYGCINEANQRAHGRSSGRQAEAWSGSSFPPAFPRRSIRSVLL